MPEVKKESKKKDIKESVDYKSGKISEAIKRKEEGMRLFASGRDAVTIVTAYKPDLKDEDLKKEIKQWRNWFYTSLYTMSEDEYKSLVSPF